MIMHRSFGEKLDATRKQNIKAWKNGFWLFLALAVGANFLLHPHHAEYGLDIYPGFWAVFGLVVTLVMVFVMKKIIQPMLVRPEEKIDVE
jgi:uncharacterized membrane protein HdeD (DUF308 family)